MDKKLLLGKRIKELRKSKGLTQDFLAEKLNIEPRQLSKLETGKNYPSFETTLLILNAFDITFEELINYKHLENSIDYKEILSKEIKKLDEKKAKIIFKLIRNLFV